MDELNETTVDETIEAVEAIKDVPTQGNGGFVLGIIGTSVVAGVCALAAAKKSGKLDELKAKHNAKKIEKLEKQLEDRKNRYTVIENVKSEEDDK